MSEPESGRKKSGTGACPICKKVSVAQFRPFCSQRCADLDLGRWLKGAYAIPAVEEDDPDDDDAASQLSHLA
ncbi:MAG: DNA gyrase inhibitor YacG [Alphaproteobacteria bacterium]|nr:DNA gyrase inhibitor YacG [Alphaproteobacteria bacterium]MDE2164475.1 DNA gyrase inhibitor YacG [Alphaproteobacteria bacterium]MDE2500361.1 DNA gyrase inhibitor YacG [Alphaproteobacteria bacterium]